MKLIKKRKRSQTGPEIEQSEDQTGKQTSSFPKLLGKGNNSNDKLFPKLHWWSKRHVMLIKQCKRTLTWRASGVKYSKSYQSKSTEVLLTKFIRSIKSESTWKTAPVTHMLLQAGDSQTLARVKGRSICSQPITPFMNTLSSVAFVILK